MTNIPLCHAVQKLALLGLFAPVLLQAANPSSGQPESGAGLARTMRILQTSTAENPPQLRILSYGQSIVGQGFADRAIAEFLKKNYPNVRVNISNKAIGGYQAPLIRRTAWQDLYNQNPDLVIFHDYGGYDGEIDEIFDNIAKYTVADVLTWTHHIDATPDEANGNQERTSEIVRKAAAKHGWEVVDIRALWKKQLVQGAEASDFLADSIHLNARGGALLGEALATRFQVVATSGDSASRREAVLPLDAAAAVSGWKAQDGGLVSVPGSPLRITFHGNRLDLAPLPNTKGGAKILLDGRPPSTLPDTLAVSRSGNAPGGWWPAITLVTLKPQAAAQKYTMKFRDVAPDGSAYVFALEGSVSGEEGEGRAGEDFVSRSGSVAIRAADIALASVKQNTQKDLPAEFTVEWEVFSMSKNSWTGADDAFPETVIRCWTDGPHTLEILPDDGGTAGFREMRVFSPSGQPAIEAQAASAKTNG